MSNSPSKISQRTRTPFIKVRDLETMLSFDSPDLLGDLVIPTHVDSDEDGIMDNVIDHKMDPIILREDVERKLKHDVADLVKAHIHKFYVSPHQSVPPGKSFFIHSTEEFCELVKRFSWQFRENIISEHSLTHINVVGVELSKIHKRAIYEQILFYFNVREVVHMRLEKVLSSYESQFASLFRQLTDSLWRELTDSHQTMVGSLKGLVITEDYKQYIRNKVDRQCHQ